MSDFIIPAARTTAVRRAPQSLLIYGNYKVGKTASVAALPDSLLAELQPGGADYLTYGRVIDVKGAQEFLGLLAHLTAQRKAGTPVCRRLVIDHLGVLDDWMFELALRAFQASPLGKGKYMELKRITDVPNAGGTGGSPGWAWYWEELGQMYDRILMAAEEVIYVAHIRDKSINKESGDVVVQDVDLTGQKARRLFCGQTSAIGFMYRVKDAGEDQLRLSFKTSDSLVCGSSCSHLTGREFVIGRSRDNKPPSFDWSEIFEPKATV